MVKQKLVLTFQKDADANAWVKLDPRVRAMVWEVTYLARRLGFLVVVTSTIRTDGIHATGSAVDIDFVDQGDPTGGYYTMGETAAKYINKTWKYGRGWLGRTKPSAIWHGSDDLTSRTGHHLHLQTPAGRPMRLLP